MTVPGFGRPIPPPPTRPPTAGLPRDPRVAATAALLNLSGVGAGYLYLRRWRRAIPSWIATGALLRAALPVEADGIPGLWPVLYAGWLVLTALDGWRLAGPAPVAGRGPWLPLTAGVLLLAGPATAGVFFGRAREQALEDDLTERLVAADALVGRAAGEPFTVAEDSYRSALTEYLAVRADHPETDAAGTVPDHVDDLYRRATGGGSADDPCAVLDPLRFFRELPGEFDDSEADRLAERAVEALPEPLHGCGLLRADGSGVAAAEAPLTELLADHADSAYATGLPDELGERQRAAIGALAEEAPCEALERLRSLNELLGALPGEAFSRMAAEGQEPVPEGLYQCGTDRFLAGAFTDAGETLTELVDEHPGHQRVDRAGDILIAARIAEHMPAAGAELPPDPGSASGPTITVEVFNDSPYELELLYTGPRTGSERVGACDGCSLYPADPGDSACADSGIDYPSTTLELPVGDYWFLHQSPGQATSPLVEADTFEPDYIYTYCSYITEDDLLPGGGTDI
ncbi:hypothetical protein [Streptomyces specialis]|uniref:hypothetical protein n=1 Tax=Streptomyces specialis TaxID=498367 RepID=UPI00073E5C80|nr:hypothetical protein [Streptomyces specialis]